MKNLLTILGTITIAGLVGNAPTPEKNNIYQQINNLETLNRNKRASYISKKLDIYPIKQETPYYCAPATGVMILRYLGFHQRYNHYSGNDDLDQTNVSYVMQTTRNSGTTMANFASGINDWIGNRLNGRQYSRLNLSDIYNHRLGEGANTLFQIIRNSLENNMPVALLHSGRNIVSRNPEFQPHAMLFYGYSGYTDSPENITYNFVDPWDGNTYEINARDLFNYGLDWNTSEIVAYISNSQSETETQVLRPNQTEPMEIGGNCNYLIQNFDHFCEINLSIGKNRFTRAINDNQCPLINENSPFFQKDKKDVFEVDYQVLSHDKIKFKASLKTSLAIEKMFFENNENGFKKYLLALFKKMPKNDNTGWGGSISNDDYDCIKNAIYDNYGRFHTFIKDLSNSKTYSSILVTVYRGYTAGSKDSEVTISLV